MFLGTENVVFTKFNGLQGSHKTIEPHTSFKPGDSFASTSALHLMSFLLASRVFSPRYCKHGAVEKVSSGGKQCFFITAAMVMDRICGTECMRDWFFRLKKRPPSTSTATRVIK